VCENGSASRGSRSSSNESTVRDINKCRQTIEVAVITPQARADDCCSGSIDRENWSTVRRLRPSRHLLYLGPRSDLLIADALVSMNDPPAPSKSTSSVRSAAEVRAPAWTDMRAGACTKCHQNAVYGRPPGLSHDYYSTFSRRERAYWPPAERLMACSPHANTLSLKLVLKRRTQLLEIGLCSSTTTRSNHRWP